MGFFVLNKQIKFKEGFFMKVRVCLFLTIALLVSMCGLCFALESVRSMDIESAAMGFVSDKFVDNQGNKKISFDSVYTKWFTTGLNYNASKLDSQKFIELRNQ